MRTIANFGEKNYEISQLVWFEQVSKQSRT